MAIGSRVPAPLRRIFAGTNALTADKAKLARAEELERGGTSNRDVWSQTGWWRGPEGKWRFEIDDSAAKVGGVDSLKWLQENGVGQLPLSEYASHPDFFAAYPELARSLTVFDRKMPPAHLGSYGPGAITLRRGLSAEKAKSPFLHELQHSVQDREGFAQGGSPSALHSQAMDEYRRLAGEAEARAVQTRRNLTPQQRATAFPLDSYDTPLDKLIVRK
jgi:hypothetical protein